MHWSESVRVHAGVFDVHAGHLRHQYRVAHARLHLHMRVHHAIMVFDMRAFMLLCILRVFFYAIFAS